MFGITTRRTSVFAMATFLLIILEPQQIEARMTLQQLRNALKPMAKTCIRTGDVDPAIAAASKDGVLPPDRGLQCYLLCIYTQMKVAKDGKLNIPVMHKQIDMMMPLDIVEKSKAASQMCFDTSNAEDDCERSWQFTKCYFEADPSIYFFP